MLWWWLLACTSPDPDSARELSPCEQTMSVEIGQGEAAFEPFGDAPEAVMVHGPQGGWHVLASVRASPVGAIGDIVYTITDLASGVEVSSNRYAVAMVPEGDCGGSFPGMYGFLDVSGLQQGEHDTPPELLAGHQLRLLIELSDDEERVGTAQIDVLAVPDPIDVSSDGEDEP